MPLQERTAKRARLKEEDATAYIQASTLPDGGDSTNPAPPAISKESKVRCRLLDEPWIATCKII